MIKIKNKKDVGEFNYSAGDVKLFGYIVPEGSYYGLYEDTVWIVHSADVYHIINDFSDCPTKLYILTIPEISKNKIRFSLKKIPFEEPLCRHIMECIKERNDAGLAEDLPLCSILEKETIFFGKLLPKGTIIGKYKKNQPYYYLRNAEGYNVKAFKESPIINILNPQTNNFNSSSFMLKSNYCKLIKEKLNNYSGKIPLYSDIYVPSAEKSDRIKSISDMIKFTNLNKLFWHKKIEGNSIQYYCRKNGEVYYYVRKINSSFGSGKLSYRNFQKELKGCKIDMIILDSLIQKHLSHHYYERYKKVAEERKQLPKEVFKIKAADFLVRTNSFKCYHDNHHLIDIIGILPVLTEDGKITETRVSCAYCEQCKYFFISDHEYKKVKKKYVIMCRVITEADYINNVGNLRMFYQNMNAESILKEYGYNVQSKNPLTEEQRRTILRYLFNNKILPGYTITNYLSAFIAQKKYMRTHAMAVKKWKADLEYFDDYIIEHSDDESEVFVMSIRKKEKMYNSSTLSYDIIDD